ncbi:hypothetical protein [Micromonospora zamorensis]|uniref:hypothetical protein n=1 Tax=Micromonospora zamorensis TaxID=709883 RepID=UPI002ED1C2A4|nr:hypothetical protein OG886_29230 [Micromonospora zamorensis]
MTKTITRRLVAVAAPGDTAASVGRLVLEPTNRGYAGSLPVAVVNRGQDASYLGLTITEPVPGLNVTMGNTGTRAYDAGDLIVVLPVEATLDWTGTNIGGCFHQDQTDDLLTMTCTGDGPIPVGGTGPTGLVSR